MNALAYIASISLALASCAQCASGDGDEGQVKGGAVTFSKCVKVAEDGGGGIQYSVTQSGYPSRKGTYDECNLTYSIVGDEFPGEMYRCDLGLFLCVASGQGLKIVAPRYKGSGERNNLIKINLNNWGDLEEISVDKDNCQKYKITMSEPEWSVKTEIYRICPGVGMVELDALDGRGNIILKMRLESQLGLLSDFASY